MKLDADPGFPTGGPPRSWVHGLRLAFFFFFFLAGGQIGAGGG